MPGIQYIKTWLPVPDDRSTWVTEIVEGKRFQIKTDKKIDQNNDIKWTIKVGRTDQWFGFTTEYIRSKSCNGGYQSFNGKEGFFHRAGILTFLKTSTQLQVWFDDVLEVSWVYQNSRCAMRHKLKGLQFKSNDNEKDTVSTHYRYEPGNE